MIHSRTKKQIFLALLVALVPASTVYPLSWGSLATSFSANASQLWNGACSALSNMSPKMVAVGAVLTAGVVAGIYWFNKSKRIKGGQQFAIATEQGKSDIDSEQELAGRIDEVTDRVDNLISLGESALGNFVLDELVDLRKQVRAGLVQVNSEISVIENAVLLRGSGSVDVFRDRLGVPNKCGEDALDERHRKTCSSGNGAVQKLLLSGDAINRLNDKLTILRRKAVLVGDYLKPIDERIELLEERSAELREALIASYKK